MKKIFILRQFETIKEKSVFTSMVVFADSEEEVRRIASWNKEVNLDRCEIRELDLETMPSQIIVSSRREYNS